MLPGVEEVLKWIQKSSLHLVQGLKVSNLRKSLANPFFPKEEKADVVSTKLKLLGFVCVTDGISW